MSKHIVTTIRFDYTVTDNQFVAFDHSNTLDMAIDAFLDPESGDRFDVLTHSIMDTGGDT